jgi:hypothetical protein
MHGDHGPRLFAGSRSQSHPEFPDQPARRDLLSGFSTLLAIKLPGTARSEVILKKASVLHVLRQTFHYLAEQYSTADLDSVYVFDRQGSSRRMAMWAESDSQDHRSE